MITSNIDHLQSICLKFYQHLKCDSFVLFKQKHYIMFFSSPFSSERTPIVSTPYKVNMDKFNVLNQSTFEYSDKKKVIFFSRYFWQPLSIMQNVRM